MATLLNGRELAASLRRELSIKVRELPFVPRLGVVLVGDDPSSHLYVKLKMQAADEVGVGVDKIELPKTATDSQVVSAVEGFNLRPEINGILIQLPLPPQLDEHSIISVMNPKKDADGFHPQNLERFLTGEPSITPGVSAGIMKLIAQAGQALTGKSAYLLVNSQEFALPLVKLFNDQGVTTEISTRIQPEKLATANIVVSAVGKPDSIQSKDISDGTIIIDVGTTKSGNRVVGDVAAEEFTQRNVYLSPVPGGVGPMTVAMLLWNVYQLAHEQRS